MSIYILIPSLHWRQWDFTDFYGIHFYNISKGSKSVLGNSFDKKKKMLLRACDHYVYVNAGIAYKAPLSSFGILLSFLKRGKWRSSLALAGRSCGKHLHMHLGCFAWSSCWELDCDDRAGITSVSLFSDVHTQLEILFVVVNKSN